MGGSATGPGAAGDDGACRVLLRAVRRHCDPFRDDCWSRGQPIMRGDETMPVSWSGQVGAFRRAFRRRLPAFPATARAEP